MCTSGVITLTNYTANELKGISSGWIPTRWARIAAAKASSFRRSAPSGTTRDSTLYLWIGHASDVPTPEEEVRR